MVSQTSRPKDGGLLHPFSSTHHRLTHIHSYTHMANEPCTSIWPRVPFTRFWTWTFKTQFVSAPSPPPVPPEVHPSPCTQTWPRRFGRGPTSQGCILPGSQCLLECKDTGSFLSWTPGCLPPVGPPSLGSLLSKHWWWQASVISAVAYVSKDPTHLGQIYSTIMFYEHVWGQTLC